MMVGSALRSDATLTDRTPANRPGPVHSYLIQAARLALNMLVRLSGTIFSSHRHGSSVSQSIWWRASGFLTDYFGILKTAL